MIAAMRDRVNLDLIQPKMNIQECIREQEIDERGCSSNIYQEFL